MPAKTVAEFIAYAKANPGQGQPGVVRQRHLGPSVGRTVHDDDRREDDPRALSRLRPGAHRHDRRSGSGDVRQPAVLDRAYQGRQAARARGDHRSALGRAAGRADGRRHGARATRPAPGSAWARPKARRPRSSRCSTRRSTRRLADPKIKARLAEIGGMPMGGTPADFGKFIADETEKWRKVVEFSGASVD